ncbi:uncharacterized protein LOC121757599 [Salvia splendens]|uniref:uncharacterized protein LOC121757599 n=1 Tax=Salvia splendens TaxID=180675 RepID=UPI001C26C46D|nr:uncharacterized protein LOC121757599 [Salvia splendens]
MEVVVSRDSFEGLYCVKCGIQWHSLFIVAEGRTTHSRFKIPINVNEDSMCNIKQGSVLAELIMQAKLIVWDEAPMIHKHSIEAVDRTLRHILSVCSEFSMDKSFGGKLWFLVVTLDKFCLLFLKEFSSWVPSIGDGVVGGSNDGEVVIDLPSDIVLSNTGGPLKTIVSKIYPSYMDPEELSNCLYDRVILAPTLDVVGEVNQFMISLDQSQGRVYLSSDSISNSDSTSNGSAEIHSVEFLNNLKCSGTPNHELLLKVGTPVMLLRNIDHSNGLCNDTRLIITRLGDYVLEARYWVAIIMVIKC